MAKIQFALDTFYILAAGILVIWMVAGLSMFNAGLVRARNTTDILAKDIAAFAVGILVYLLVSYHIVFGNQGAINAYIPDFHFIAADDMFPTFLRTTAYTHLAGAFFHAVLAVIPLLIIAGATAERLKFWSYLFFAIVMVGFIFPVEAYWGWGGGFLKQLGFIDAAGAGIVHLAGATAALTGVCLLGPRQGRYDTLGKTRPLPGANIPLAGLGIFMIWIGCFGFNGGSIFIATNNHFAENMAGIFINTTAAGAGGMLAAMLVARILNGAVDLTFMINGALAGLVAISASPISPSMGAAMIYGVVAGVLVVLAILLLDKWHIDDPVGAIASHGIGGILGLVSITFSQNYKALAQISGLKHGWLHQVWIQCLGIVVIIAWCLLTSLIFWHVIKLLIGLRVKPEDEYKGMDVMSCGMVAYPEFTQSGWEK